MIRCIDYSMGGDTVGPVLLALRHSSIRMTHQAVSVTHLSACQSTPPELLHGPILMTDLSSTDDIKVSGASEHLGVARPLPIEPSTVGLSAPEPSNGPRSGDTIHDQVGAEDINLNYFHNCDCGRKSKENDEGLSIVPVERIINPTFAT